MTIRNQHISGDANLKELSVVVAYCENTYNVCGGELIQKSQQVGERGIDFQATRMAKQRQQEMVKVSIQWRTTYFYRTMMVWGGSALLLTKDTFKRVTDISSSPENEFNWYLEWRRAYRFLFIKKKLYYKSEGLRKYPKTVKVVWKMLSSYSQLPVFSNKHSIQKLIETTAILFGNTNQDFLIPHPTPTEVAGSPRKRLKCTFFWKLEVGWKGCIHLQILYLPCLRITWGKQNMAQHNI